MNNLITFENLNDSIHKYYSHGITPGLSSGWDKLDKYFLLQKGLLNIVTGVPSSGKTEWMDQLILHTIKLHNWHWTVFSPENWPLSYHFQKLSEKWTGKPMFDGYNIPRMNQEEMEETIHDLSGSIVFIDPPQTNMTIDPILKLVQQSKDEFDTDAFILDPWNELEHNRPKNMSETEYIGYTLTRVRNFARKNQIDMFIVAHPTKLQKKDDGNYPVPTPYDISGCHDETTEVLTKTRGWVRHQDLTMQDEVLCFNRDTNKSFYSKPEKIWKYKVRNQRMISLNSDSFSACITPNHRLCVKGAWLTKPSFKNKFKGSGLGRPIIHDNTWKLIEADKFKGEVLMPWASILDDNTHDYNISDNELKIIGWYVSEGWRSMGSVAFCQATGPLADEMLDVVKNTGFKFYVKRKQYNPEEKEMQVIRLKNRHDARTRIFTKMLFNECGAGAQTKRLPKLWRLLSVRQKNVLLEAYLSGDGCKTYKDSWVATTVSPVLADEVQQLSLEVGRMASLRIDKSRNPKWCDKYNVNIGSRSRKTISLRKARHFSESLYSGYVYCLTVPSSVYLTRHNGKVGFYGNSANWRNKADCCISVWRDYQKNDGVVQIHVQKMRNKNLGSMGYVELYWCMANGLFFDYPEDSKEFGKHGISKM